nr:hypothetical protein CFP56_73059 [Quercus suber]
MLLQSMEWSRTLCSLPDIAIIDELDNQGARLQKLYTSWENNLDIGFVAMKWQGILCWWRYCVTLSYYKRRWLF